MDLVEYTIRIDFLVIRFGLVLIVGIRELVATVLSDYLFHFHRPTPSGIYDDILLIIFWVLLFITKKI